MSGHGLIVVVRSVVVLIFLDVRQSVGWRRMRYKAGFGRDLVGRSDMIVCGGVQ